MCKNKIEVEIYRYKNLVFGSVLNTPENLRNKHEILNYDGYALGSYSEPGITRYKLCLWGEFSSQDNKIIYFNFSTEEEAEKWIEHIKEMIDDYNTDQHQVIRVSREI